MGGPCLFSQGGQCSWEANVGKVNVAEAIVGDVNVVAPSTTVGARILNTFRIWMLRSVLISNGVTILNGKTRWSPFCSDFKWSGLFEN